MAEPQQDRVGEEVGRLVPCGPCAGTGEYPPTDGDVCSFCGGEGQVPAPPTGSSDAAAGR